MAFWLDTVVSISQKLRFEDTDGNHSVSTARSHMNSGLPLFKKKKNGYQTLRTHKGFVRMSWKMRINSEMQLDFLDELSMY